MVSISHIILLVLKQFKLKMDTVYETLNIVYFILTIYKQCMARVF